MLRLLKPSYVVKYFWRRMSAHSNVIAVCQMTAKNNIEDNMDTCISLIDTAVKHGAKFVFLPEACDFIAGNRAEISALAQPFDGKILQTLRDLANSFNVWLSVGGIHQKVSPEKVQNAHILINDKGDVVAVYHKVHLFDVELPDKNIRLKESDYVEQGDVIIPPVPTPVGNIGLSICYDMRFPELSLALRGMGADILTFPSAFTLNTGAVHWDVLLRARAIETQCYVVAAAQTGIHNPKRSSWGHAMIVDPWGTVVAQCSEGDNVAVAAIDLEIVKKVRSNMPVWSHRRYDLYSPIIGKASNIYISDLKEFKFGNTIVKEGQVFYQTSMSFAFTNKKCVLPGHVLVASKRCVKRFTELTVQEVSDLFQTVSSVQRAVENYTQASSSTICIQDGVHAGQTVEHVHAHILPRKPGDFQRNDDIYVALQQNDATGNAVREEAEMFEEAKKLRSFFYK